MTVAADPADPAGALLDAFARRRPMRAGSLIVTVFGDAIAPRGGAVRLADLIELLAGFAVKDGQIRTALSRLAADDWLGATRAGRRAIYRITAAGQRRFEAATRRIYGGPPAAWAGEWHVVLLAGMTEGRDGLRRALGWQGFGAAGPDALVHPAPDLPSLAATLAELPAGAGPVVIRGAAVGPLDDPALAALVGTAWNLDAVAGAYGAFVETFAPIGRALDRGWAAAPRTALLTRIALVHDYRRVVLRDPLLPARLMGRDWAGRAARDLARRIYRALVEPSESWIDARFAADDGPLPPAGAALARRFAEGD